MRFQDYPPQPPTNPVAVPYREACIARSFGVAFSELSFGSDPHQSIAIYPARQPRGPILAFMHGGGWTNGYKETMAFMAPAFQERGITFASVGYRLAPEHVFPAGFDDAIAGVRLLYDKAGDFGCDRDQIVVGGHSSGGHYAALLAVQRDWQERAGLPLDVIKGCLPVSGSYRFGEGAGYSMRPRFLGESANDRKASPLFNIQGRPPPFLIAWGEKEWPHLIMQANEMRDALRAIGADVTPIALESCDHFGASLAAGDSDGEWVRRAAEFAYRVTKGAAPAVAV